MIGPFRSGELKIDVPLPSAARLKLDWRGRSAGRNPGADLQPFLVEVLQAARAAGVTVEMHFEALEYFNSSTVSVLVDFVRSACAQHVPLYITYSGDVRWQRLSFDALKVFASLDHNCHVMPAGVSAPAP